MTAGVWKLGLVFGNLTLQVVILALHIYIILLCCCIISLTLENYTYFSLPFYLFILFLQFCQMQDNFLLLQLPIFWSVIFIAATVETCGQTICGICSFTESFCIFKVFFVTCYMFPSLDLVLKIVFQTSKGSTFHFQSLTKKGWWIGTYTTVCL